MLFSEDIVEILNFSRNNENIFVASLVPTQIVPRTYILVLDPFRHRAHTLAV